ncbi:hypothetical protein EOM82_06855 [bacterium]|nr:hypothetical protein [bacterium]
MFNSVLIALIPASLAFVAAAASLAYSFLKGKQDNVLKIVTEGRIRYLAGIREGYAAFIGLTHIEIIESAQAFKAKDYPYLNFLAISYGKIKSYIKPFYEIDATLLQSLDKLYLLVLQTFSGVIVDKDELPKERVRFEKLFAQYDWAYWLYIQRQANGKYIDSKNSYDEEYTKLLESLKQERYEIER